MTPAGYKIFDADTHVGPTLEVLEPYLAQRERAKLPAWEEYRYRNAKNNFMPKGSSIYTRGVRSYRRRLGTASGSEQMPTGNRAKAINAEYSGPRVERKPSTRVDYDPAARIADMDAESVDVNLMLPSGWFGTWTTTGDIVLESAMYAAYHRWMNDYCAGYPERLGGVLLVCARDIAASLAEIRRWGKSRWAWGILPYAPDGMPLDHPDLEPVWAAAQDHDLVVTLHTFTSMPPYAPGSLDSWENLFLQRSAAHPWCAMRNMAALIGNGVMDRYPKLRIATLEGGHGWLPFWLARIDEHAETCRSAIPELEHKPSEYALSGRYFQSIEIHEGAALTNSVCDILGDDVLMYSSDYPHGESRFPKSVDTVMDWPLASDRRKKLMWDNAVRCYTRSGLQ